MNRWLNFLVPYFWGHLLEGKNPEVTRGWPSRARVGRRIQWAPSSNVTLRTEGASCLQVWEEGVPLLSYPDWQILLWEIGHLVTSLNTWALFGRWRDSGPKGAALHVGCSPRELAGMYI